MQEKLKNKILKDELKTKFYNLLEDPQRKIFKENWNAFSKKIAE